MKNDREHPTCGGVLGGLPVEGGLNATRPRDGELGFWQIHLMGDEGQALRSINDVAERQLQRRVVGRCIDEVCVGKPNLKVSGQTGNRWISAFDFSVRADGVDAG